MLLSYLALCLQPSCKKMHVQCVGVFCFVTLMLKVVLVVLDWCVVEATRSRQHLAVVGLVSSCISTLSDIAKG